MNLLIFFALPIATILLAIVFEKILQSPTLVAITFFAIYLIVLFTLFALSIITNLGVGLVAIIIYTIIAFITAYIVNFVKIMRERFSCENEGRNCCLNNENLTEENFNNNGITITENITPNQNDSGRTGMIRGCYRRL